MDSHRGNELRVRTCLLLKWSVKVQYYRSNGLESKTKVLTARDI